MLLALLLYLFCIYIGYVNSLLDNCSCSSIRPSASACPYGRECDNSMIIDANCTLKCMRNMKLMYRTGIPWRSSEYLQCVDGRHRPATGSALAAPVASVACVKGNRCSSCSQLRFDAYCDLDYVCRNALTMTQTPEGCSIATCTWGDLYVISAPVPALTRPPFVTTPAPQTVGSSTGIGNVPRGFPVRQNQNSNHQQTPNIPNQFINNHPLMNPQGMITPNLPSPAIPTHGLSGNPTNGVAANPNIGLINPSTGLTGSPTSGLSPKSGKGDYDDYDYPQSKTNSGDPLSSLASKGNNGTPPSSISSQGNNGAAMTSSITNNGQSSFGSNTGSSNFGSGSSFESGSGSSSLNANNGAPSFGSSSGLGGLANTGSSSSSFGSGSGSSMSFFGPDSSSSNFGSGSSISSSNENNGASSFGSSSSGVGGLKSSSTESSSFGSGSDSSGFESSRSAFGPGSSFGSGSSPSSNNGNNGASSFGDSSKGTEGLSSGTSSFGSGSAGSSFGSGSGSASFGSKPSSSSFGSGTGDSTFGSASGSSSLSSNNANNGGASFGSSPSFRSGSSGSSFAPGSATTSFGSGSDSSSFASSSGSSSFGSGSGSSSFGSGSGSSSFGSGTGSSSFGSSSGSSGFGSGSGSSSFGSGSGGSGFGSGSGSSSFGSSSGSTSFGSGSSSSFGPDSDLLTTTGAPKLDLLGRPIVNRVRTTLGDLQLPIEDPIAARMNSHLNALKKKEDDYDYEDSPNSPSSFLARMRRGAFSFLSPVKRSLRRLQRQVFGIADETETNNKTRVARQSDGGASKLVDRVIGSVATAPVVSTAGGPQLLSDGTQFPVPTSIVPNPPGNSLQDRAGGPLSGSILASQPKELSWDKPSNGQPLITKPDPSGQGSWFSGRIDNGWTNGNDARITDNLRDPVVFATKPPTTTSIPITTTVALTTPALPTLASTTTLETTTVTTTTTTTTTLPASTTASHAVPLPQPILSLPDDADSIGQLTRPSTVTKDTMTPPSTAPKNSIPSTVMKQSSRLIDDDSRIPMPRTTPRPSHLIDFDSTQPRPMMITPPSRSLIDGEANTPITVTPTPSIPMTTRILAPAMTWTGPGRLVCSGSGLWYDDNFALQQSGRVTCAKRKSCGTCFAPPPVQQCSIGQECGTSQITVVEDENGCVKGHCGDGESYITVRDPVSGTVYSDIRELSCDPFGRWRSTVHDIAGEEVEASCYWPKCKKCALRELPCPTGRYCDMSLLAEPDQAQKCYSIKCGSGSRLLIRDDSGRVRAAAKIDCSQNANWVLTDLTTGEEVGVAGVEAAVTCEYNPPPCQLCPLIAEAKECPGASHRPCFPLTQKGGVAAKSCRLIGCEPGDEIWVKLQSGWTRPPKLTMLGCMGEQGWVGNDGETRLPLGGEAICKRAACDNCVVPTISSFCPKEHGTKGCDSFAMRRNGTRVDQNTGCTTIVCPNEGKIAFHNPVTRSFVASTPAMHCANGTWLTDVGDPVPPQLHVTCVEWSGDRSVCGNGGCTYELEDQHAMVRYSAVGGCYELYCSNGNIFGFNPRTQKWQSANQGHFTCTERGWKPAYGIRVDDLYDFGFHIRIRCGQ